MEKVFESRWIDKIENDYIIHNRHHIETVFTSIWYDVHEKLGKDACQHLNIINFAIYFAAKRKYIGGLSKQ